MTITHVAHLFGGPADGQTYPIEEDGSLEPRYKGPRLAISIAEAELRREATDADDVPVEVKIHAYLREPMPAPHLSTMTENHWRYHYAGISEGSTP